MTFPEFIFHTSLTILNRPKTDETEYTKCLIMLESYDILRVCFYSYRITLNGSKRKIGNTKSVWEHGHIDIFFRICFLSFVSCHSKRIKERRTGIYYVYHKRKTHIVTFIKNTLLLQQSIWKWTEYTETF